MKKRILSILCAAAILFSFTAVPSVSAETPSGQLFADEMEDLSKVSSLSGQWDVFKNHADTGLSVVGRKTVSETNYLYYSFSNKYVGELSVNVAEYTGFFTVNQVPVSVKSEGSSAWVDVVMDASVPTDIPGKEDSAFKQVTLTAASLPDNVSEVRIGLTNDVGWTLFIDRVSMSLKEKTGLKTVTDPLTSLSLLSSYDGQWDVLNPHSEFGLSVIGRTSTASNNNIYYNYSNEYVAALSIDVVEYEGFFSAAQVPVSVRVQGSDIWQTVPVIAGTPTDISGKEGLNFKSVTLTAQMLPAKVVAVRIGLENTVNWTLFLDNITFSLMEKSDIFYSTDEFSSQDNISASDGAWSLFNPHNDFGLSVIGRTDVSAPNNIYYSVSEKYIIVLRINIVEYAGFVTPDKVPVAVKTEGSNEWVSVNMTAGDLKDITGFETANFKSRTLKCETLPENVTDVRIGLTNEPAWTLFLDSVTLATENKAILPGDLNEDGQVGLKDLVRFKKVLAQGGSYLTAFDLNGDRTVDASDLIVLKKALIGITPLDSAEVIILKREAAYYRSVTDTETAWIASTQLPSGAIPINMGSADGTVTLNPYFADMSASALLERSQLYTANVVTYMNWHFAHLNPDGTIYDYTSKDGVEATQSTYDSSDSYAATFLSLLWKYYQKTNDSAYILAHYNEIEKIVGALYSTMDNDLTYATSTYPVKYLMDNCEVYEGLNDASQLYNQVIVPGISEAGATKNRLEASRSSILTAIENKLWNAGGYYEIGIGKTGTPVGSFDWTQYYPSAMAQMFPIITGVIAPDSERAQALYSSFIANHDIFNINAVDSYYCFAVRAAAKLNDSKTLRQYMSYYVAAVDQHSFCYTPYTAQVVLAMEIMANQISAQLG